MTAPNCLMVCVVAAQVALVFKADGARVFSETLGIDITERDFADSPGGIAYEVGIMGRSVLVVTTSALSSPCLP